jgi:hypothetical protein
MLRHGVIISEGGGGAVIGSIIITHGRLAEKLVAATEHVVRPQTGVRAIS